MLFYEWLELQEESGIDFRVSNISSSILGNIRDTIVKIPENEFPNKKFIDNKIQIQTSDSRNQQKININLEWEIRWVTSNNTATGFCRVDVKELATPNNFEMSIQYNNFKRDFANVHSGNFDWSPLIRLVNRKVGLIVEAVDNNASRQSPNQYSI